MLIETEFHDESEQSISGTFGPGFARAVFSLEPGDWSGPIESGYGLHLVRVSTLQTAQLRPFSEVRERVAQEWRREQEKSAKERYLAELRKKYGLVADDAVKPLVAPAGGRQSGTPMSTRCRADLSASLGRAVIVGMAGLFGFSGLFWQSATCIAHEVRPSYLELREDRAGEFDVLLKTPMRGELRLALAATFSGRADAITPITMRATGDAAVQTWRFKALDPLPGQTVRIDGLENTMTDALVRVVFLDGTSWVRRLTPQQPAATIPPRQSGWSVAGLYLKLGVEHILLGIDHLLFVLALLIITRGTWLLVKTVTAFTVAHSITLALATLGIRARAVRAGRGGDRAEHRVRRRRDRPPAAGARRLDGESAVDRGVRVRPSARARLCRRLERGGSARGAHPVGAVVLQRRGRDRPAAVHRNCAVPVRIGPAHSHIRPALGRLGRPYAIGSIAMFWVIERVAAF